MKPLTLTASPVAAITCLFAVWLCGGLLIYLPNNGGAGLSLPFNCLSWAIVGMAVALFGIFSPSTGVSFMPGDRLLLLGALCWSLPLLWSPSAQAARESLSHVLALWGLLGFCWLLRRMPLTNLWRQRWIVLIGVAAVLQAGYGLLQTLGYAGVTFVNNRPLGIFQQVNVLASFVATGLVCLLYSVLLLPSSRLYQWLALLFLAFILPLLQSRTGLLGSLVGGGVVLVLSMKRSRGITRHQVIALLLMVIGFSGALLWQSGIWFAPPQGIVTIDKESTTLSRMLIIRTTWHMIIQHPLAGTGYGGFEAAFTEQLYRDGAPSMTMFHPHNELLYAWAEGGLPGIFGLLLMITGILRLIFHRHGQGLAGMALMVPVSVHMSLEYPLYQSVAHGLVLVILLHIATGDTPVPELDGRRKRIYRILLIAVGGLFMVCSLAALRTGLALTAIERQGFMPLAINEKETISALPFPASQYGRLDFARHNALLIRFNQTRDPQLLLQFDTWAQAYLTRRSNADVAANRLLVAKNLMPDNAAAVCLWAHRRWRDDPRFIPCGDVREHQG